MSAAKEYESHRSKDLFLIICLSLIPVLLHLYVNAFAGYGYFRDEFYYLACSQKLAAGYVDQPPLSILILFISNLIFGDSVFGLRLLPAIANGFIVFFTCLMVKRMGGGKTSVLISSIAVIFTPIYLGMCSIYSMNCFDILLWSIAFYLIILMTDESSVSYWVILGVTMGLGLMNKIGFSWMIAGFYAGLILSDKKKELLTFKSYLTGLIALLIFTPYIVWNFQNDFAHVEFIRNATSGKYSELSRTDFLAGQFLNMNPVNAVVWISGLIFFFTKAGKKFRIAGIIFLTVFSILMINGHSKAEYLAAAYTPLFAGGGVLIESLTRERFKFLRYAIAALIISFGIVAIPFALPILPVESFISYSKALGMKPSTSENKELSELPQHYADMFGWDDFAKEVSRVYQTIPESEKEKTVVYCENYGEAGAIDFYKRKTYFADKYPLPSAISGHNNYWLWGYGNFENPVVIIIGGNKEDHEEEFESVTESGFHTSQYSMPYENNLKIFIARGLKGSIKDVWEGNRNYD